MKKEPALHVQGRTLQHKQEASLKEIDTKNLSSSCNAPSTSTTESSSASAKKIRIQPGTEMSNETFEDIPEISSGYGHVCNCCTCGHFDIG